MRFLKNFKKSGALTLLLAFSFAFAAAQQQDEEALQLINKHRKKQYKEFKGSESPLLPKDKKRFKGLNYYPIDLKYRVQAKFRRTENEPLFKMKTTTTRLPEYTKYGEVTFSIDSTSYTLEVYQSPEIMKRPGYEDYLFIPFTDLTNGEETYEVGRYLEFRIPKSEDVIIDFNLCYNPYCSYNPNYSCPIPPAPNQLPIAIPVGEKKFKDH
ncbi:DUF1684 domain-containing protein [Chryseosolibacter indicus]|uniref:DUF1684 domain-containing protein n=1 Tax=Chryseosolibacter indicus TaxID=2782351 RepID=A0ABS5VPS6_9BACT|nr:DUF1684 domain-containing protein [Chryseosolibacter indicus]MBT1703437.1 DUF1684 domain-containing protein [Chryseosolibacter indicus]